MDIIVSEVHRVSLSDPEATHEVLRFTNKDDESYEESIGAIALTKDDDKLLLCCKYGVAIGSFLTQETSYILKYPGDQTRYRSNDGIVDPWGNLWIGTMSDFFVGGVETEGTLFHVDSQTLKVTTMLTNCQIPNGLAFSKDGKSFFWTDLKTFIILKFDYDHETNTLSNQREFVNTRKHAVSTILEGINSPEPDGFTMTDDEEIFGTIFSGSKVVHYGPTGGDEVLEVFELPAANITSCIIAGNDTLYITSAQTHLDDASKCHPASNKEGDLGGFLFRVKLLKPVKAQVKNIWQGQV